MTSDKEQQQPLLRVEHLSKHFPVNKGFFRRQVGTVKAVEDISFELKKGSTFGLVGESGCGKSSLGRTIIRLYEPSQGEIYFDGKAFHSLSGSDLRQARQSIQMIFQDPFASLDPRMTVGQILAEPFKVHPIIPPTDIPQRAMELLKLVGLKSVHINRYPHEFSGGQRQRISIARALSLKPKFVIADEPVSALDVSIQAQILNLLQDLQTEFDLTYLFISHDLGVIEHMCDTIAVMYLGRIVEIGARDTILKNPLHPYTKALIEAVPVPGLRRSREKKHLRGEIPSPLNPPSGCAFHPRCPYAMERCQRERPHLLNHKGQEQQTACWLYDKTLSTKQS